LGDVGVTACRRFAGKESLGRLEEGRFRVGSALRLQTLENALEELKGPTAMENLFRSPGVERFLSIAVLGVLKIEREVLPIAAAFLGRRLIAGIGEKVPQRCQQEGAELAALTF